MTKKSTCPHLGLDHVGGLLADHDGRCIGIAADQGRHHRRIDDAQAVEAVDFQTGVDHGHRVAAHFDGADRVIHGIDALAPGYIDTEMNHDFWSTPSGEKLAKRIPQRRVGAESDLDGAIMLLASSASRYMTGSVVTVDGGFLLT